MPRGSRNLDYKYLYGDFSKYTPTSRKFRLPGGISSNEALLTFFWSAFIAWPTERKHTNFRFSIRNLRQRRTCQRIVNANELCRLPKHSRDHDHADSE